MAELRTIVSTLALSQTIERMAYAAARDSLPGDGMFNAEQLDKMLTERMPTYRQIAQVMFWAMLTPDERCR